MERCEFNLRIINGREKQWTVVENQKQVPEPVLRASIRIGVFSFAGFLDFWIFGFWKYTTRQLELRVVRL
ncbi:hypothetical protein K402DRAFT_170300 [Aulographum hederae CBS 113979]|uniref:Uncharacterized protein n=1 Tax=Aulographum hederae CBS 113979 TaxID=1176131 RepID=A0A6G1HDQ1_9PEZI|nr:hypothetical protein K402DRAFT_170300 [Aulographum hederae CBS 113979]